MFQYFSLNSAISVYIISYQYKTVSLSVKYYLEGETVQKKVIQIDEIPMQ